MGMNCHKFAHTFASPKPGNYKGWQMRSKFSRVALSCMKVSVEVEENFSSAASPSISSQNAATDLCEQVFSGYCFAQDGLHSGLVGLVWSVGTLQYTKNPTLPPNSMQTPNRNANQNSQE